MPRQRAFGTTGQSFADPASTGGEARLKLRQCGHPCSVDEAVMEITASADAELVLVEVAAG
ncbi:hypothetical protein [Belnapia rosea]|uniref:hypothetical protein n=1 Tax=Belnapia rosea TaxID=938405 RepID=UPI00159FCC62|nr:hypothetical protein [Belnapia rosea]